MIVVMVNNSISKQKHVSVLLKLLTSLRLNAFPVIFLIISILTARNVRNVMRIRQSMPTVMDALTVNLLNPFLMVTLVNHPVILSLIKFGTLLKRNVCVPDSKTILMVLNVFHVSCPNISIPNKKHVFTAPRVSISKY